MSDFLWNSISLFGPGTPFAQNGAQKSSPDGRQSGTGISTMLPYYPTLSLGNACHTGSRHLPRRLARGIAYEPIKLHSICMDLSSTRFYPTVEVVLLR
jgi:hypothetical protein